MLSFSMFIMMSQADEPDWATTIDNVVPSIVSIKISSNRFFDTESASNSVATGFIVDAENGIILTNRHVVEPGPVTSQAILLNNEEIDIWPVYRDPVHDFGFYRYNPADIDFLTVKGLELCVDCPEVGMPVRLIGNDAGEKISILEATIARLDRNTPNYGWGKYNDFNSFYIQAAAGSSGGSSGSPVLNIEGKVIALNAGGKTRAAASFFLPLHRVERALKKMQAGEDISRGTLLGTFLFEPFDQAKRLGLSKDEEAGFREEFPARDGVLVLEKITPEGPLAKHFKEGDVLLRINGQRVSDFFTLEDILDSHVEKKIQIEMERSGKIISEDIVVTDLHSVTPAQFVEACGGIVNTLSYQMGRHFPIPLTGVYVAFPGYCLQNGGLSRGTVITALNGEYVADLQDFWRIASTFTDSQPIIVDYFSLYEPKQKRRTVIVWDRKWFPMELWTRNDVEGIWEPQKADDQAEEWSMVYPPTRYPEEKDRRARKLASSMVVVRFSIPFSIQGVYGDSFFGSGFIVDKEEGLVVVDRDTVPIGLGDVRISFAGDLTIPAEVVWLHPEHNMALIKYDPLLIGTTPVTEVEFSQKPLAEKQSSYFYGLNYDYEIVGGKVRVDRLEDVYLPFPRVPFFRDSNLEVAVLDGAVDSVGGLLVDKKARVLGQWASFPDLSSKEVSRSLFVIPAEIILEAIDSYYNGGVLQTLGVEFEELNLIEAREYGLNPLTLEGELPKKFYTVSRIAADVPAASALELSDIILSVNGSAIYSIRDLEREYRKGAVDLKILRQTEVIEKKIGTVSLSGEALKTLLFWNGTVIHEVPWAARYQKSSAPKGAYISWCERGAPCASDGLTPTYRIIRVEDTEIKDIEQLIEMIKTLAGKESIRVELEALNGEPSTIALRPDELYWKTRLLRRNGAEWSFDLSVEETAISK